MDLENWDHSYCKYKKSRTEDKNHRSIGIDETKVDDLQGVKHLLYRANQISTPVNELGTKCGYVPQCTSDYEALKLHWTYKVIMGNNDIFVRRAKSVSHFVPKTYTYGPLCPPYYTFISREAFKLASQKQLPSTLIHFQNCILRTGCGIDETFGK